MSDLNADPAKHSDRFWHAALQAVTKERDMLQEVLLSLKDELTLRDERDAARALARHYYALLGAAGLHTSHEEQEAPAWIEALP